MSLAESATHTKFSPRFMHCLLRLSSATAAARKQQPHIIEKGMATMPSVFATAIKGTNGMGHEMQGEEERKAEAQL